MARDIWFGVHVPPEGKNFDQMKSICRRVEEGGFELFTITDHLLNMQNPNGPSNHPLECWTTLAGLAAVTSKIKLASLVTCYKYRRPTVLAKMATTVDIISNGRLILGIGAGNAGATRRSLKASLMGFHRTRKGLEGSGKPRKYARRCLLGNEPRTTASSTEWMTS